MSDTPSSCPKCGHEQPAGFDECVQCGVVFAKYQPPPAAPDIDEGEASHAGVQPASLPDAYDVDSARNALSIAREILPPVESAYVPSGAISALGLVMVVLGSAMGALFGAIAGMLAWGAGGILVKLLVGLSGFLYEFCAVPIILLILTVIVAALAYLLRVYAVSWVAAFAVAQLGKLGKNRNVPVAVIFALVAGGGAGLFLLSEIPRLLPELEMSTVEELGIEEASPLIGSLDGLSGALAYWGDGTWTRRLNAAAAIFMALFAAGLVAEHVGQQKFCERCSEYMASTVLGKSSWEEAQILADAHARRDFAAMKHLLGPRSLGPCETSLFTCPGCREGYVESTAVYFWSDKGDDRDDQVDDRWLFASSRLGREDVRMLR